MAVPPDIQRLVHVVPRPPGEPIAPGATDDDIRGFERRTGVALPAEFRDWLRFTNAPVIGPGGFYGVGKSDAIEDIELAYGLEPAWRAGHWVPVAGDGCGDVI